MEKSLSKYSDFDFRAMSSVTMWQLRSVLCVMFFYVSCNARGFHNEKGYRDSTLFSRGDFQ